MSVCCECRVLSGRGLCVELITRPGQSYRMWRVYDRETLTVRRPWPTRGCRAMEKILQAPKKLRIATPHASRYGIAFG